MKQIKLIASTIALSSCTMSITPDGRPTFGVDPVAAVAAYNAYAAKKNMPPVAVLPETQPALPTVVPQK